MTIANRKVRFNAVALRAVLAIMILLIFGLAGVGFTFAQQKLLAYAKDISHKKADAEASNNTINSLRNMEQKLNSNQAISQKINELRAVSEFPEFEIVDQIREIAARNNIAISSFSYGSSDQGSAEGVTGTTPPAAATPPAATAQPTTPGAAANANAGKTISLTVNLASPVEYGNYLQFIYDIEQNLPKMQVEGVGVRMGGSSSDSEGQSETSNQSGLSVDPLVIKMYLKDGQ